MIHAFATSNILFRKEGTSKKLSCGAIHINKRVGPLIQRNITSSKKYAIIPPLAVLRNYVKYFWAIQTEVLPAGKFSFRTLVDDSSGIIFQHIQGKSAIKRIGSPISGNHSTGKSKRKTR